MFTGIIQTQLAPVAVEELEEFARFNFEFPDSLLQGLQIGASVAINGVCLTVRTINGQQVSFDAIKQTLAITNLGQLRAGQTANIERAAKIGDEIGGHLISGHVMSTVKVLAVEDSENNRVVWFERPEEWAKMLLDKGYVALNGASLTIAHVEDDRFAVYLIPETREVTTFGTVQVGDAINLEIDPQTQAVVSTVERLLADPAALAALKS